MPKPKNPQVALARKAQQLKQENSDKTADYPSDQNSDPGMQRIEHTDQAPSGALDDVGDKPSRERSRERR